MTTAQTVEHDITQITENVFSSMLGLEAKRREASAEAGSSTPEMMLTSLVQITGAWCGAVTFDCSREMAKRIASAMFGSDPASVPDSEICDALGEVANMVGGAYKSMLPTPVNLSLPSVTEGVGYRMFIPGSRMLARTSFECSGETISVTVLTRDDKG
ncbi:MAG: chemotaxis protein CheX [Planctomycetes bacterium]|nr:chemotaxis protein CheX [Planctomycetota bacterium]